LKKLLSTLLVCYCCTGQAQKAASVTTDLSLLRSIGEGQGFTVIGQAVQFQYHFAPKESGYAWISYYTPGKYQNILAATAKDPATSPSTLDYTVNSEIRYRQISLGWKHFFKGWYDSEEPVNLYGSAGFGLLFSKIENTYDPSIDTSIYTIPNKAAAGSDEARRLTFDLALGAEFRLGAGIYFYTDVRTWLQASSTPSPYYFDNHTPQVIMLNGGIRILFD
jgi:hypothetical protein